MEVEVTCGRVICFFLISFVLDFWFRLIISIIDTNIRALIWKEEKIWKEDFRWTWVFVEKISGDFE